MPYRYVARPGGQRVRESIPAPVNLERSAADILDEVGNDAGAAGRYLAAESKADKPRKTLISKLEGIAHG